MKKELSIKELLSLSPSELKEIIIPDKEVKDKPIPGQYCIYKTHSEGSLEENLQNRTITDQSTIVYLQARSKSNGVIRIQNTFVIVGLQSLIPLSSDVFSRIKKLHYNTIRRSIIAPRGFSSNSLIKYLKNITSKILDPERTDIRLTNEGYIDLIIHYPEITIKNSAEQKHRVKDFYVGLSFSKDLALRDLQVARTTFSSIEKNPRTTNAQFYIHSHLPGEYPGNWDSSFCYGNTPIREALFQLQAGHIELLTTFLVNFEHIIGWESLEGAPYKHMSDYLRTLQAFNQSRAPIRAPLYRQNNLEKRELIMSTAYNGFKNYISNNPKEAVEGLADIRYDQHGGVKITNSGKKFIHFVLDRILYEVPELEHCRVFYPMRDGVSIEEPSGAPNEEMVKQVCERLDGQKSQVMFKGKRVPLKVEYVPYKSSENEYRVHTEIVDHVIERLEMEITHFLLIKNLNNNDEREKNTRETVSA